MTQHRWGTKDGWEAMAGWDRPMQSFFFQASKLCTCMDNENDDAPECGACHGRGEVYLYENLDDNTLSMGRMSLAQVQQRMEQYLTGYPPKLLERLLADQANDAGNEITEYPSVGVAR